MTGKIFGNETIKAQSIFWFLVVTFFDRALTLTELKRQLWDDLDRLKEYFLQRDPARTGKLKRKDCYTLLRACRLPVDVEVIERILDV